MLKSVLRALEKVPGLRLAEPGEFALRAFENGKIDLAEVEGLADLVASETEAQRKQAIRIVGGELSRETESIRALLIRAMSALEAQIDFSDVEDAESFTVDDVRRLISEAVQRIRTMLASAHSGERLREGLNVCHRRAAQCREVDVDECAFKRDVSIVSPHPGTTRDLVEVALDLSGYPVTLVDTAGIRSTKMKSNLRVLGEHDAEPRPQI